MGTLSPGGGSHGQQLGPVQLGTSGQAKDRAGNRF